MSVCRPAAWVALGFCLVLPGLPVSPLAAQRPQIIRDRVEPVWLEGNSRFWYRIGLPGGGAEFVLVDAKRGERRPAFDHAAVAEWVSGQLGRPVGVAELPFRRLTYRDDGSVLELDGPDLRCRLNLADGSLERVAVPAEENAAGLFRPARPSRDEGEESELRIANALDAPLRLFWIDREGKRVPYGEIAAGETATQHTWAGHVFLVEGEPVSGEVCFAATAEPRTVRLDAASVAGVREETRRERGRGRRGRELARNRPATSPDGNWTAFVRDDDLWLKDAADEEAWPLAEDGSEERTFRRDSSRARLISMQYDLPDPPEDAADLLWSPDSRFVVAWQTEKVPERLVQYVQSLPDADVHPVLQSYPYLKAGDPVPVSRPRVFELASRREIPVDGALFPNPWELRFLRWSEDGNRAFLHYNERGHQTIRLLELELATGKVRTVVEETSPTFIHYSDGGKSELHWLPAALSGNRPGRGSDPNSLRGLRALASDPDGSRTGELLWASERSGWNHIYRYDIATGAVINAMTAGEWNVKRIEQVDAEAGVAWFFAVGIAEGQDPYHEHFCRVNFDGSGLKVLTAGDGTHEINWSPDRKFFIDRWSRVDLPPVHELRSAEGEQVLTLETAEVAAFEAAGGRMPTRFVAKGRDGTTDIWGILHWPSKIDPGQRYPVLEQIYAGPHDHHVPKRFQARHGAQRMADQGFVVVQIDGMGTAWRSKAFHDVCWRNLKDAGFPDRIAWMKTAAKEFPELDIERVGVYGGSAGGQNAMAAVLWHSDFYKAAAADCGCHDNRMDKIWWSEQWMGWPVGEQYAANSNAENAELLGGALLLTVGEMDQNVDPATTTQVVGRLIKADKDFEFLLVVGGGHGAGDLPWAARKRLEFFRRHLGSPTPATRQQP